MILLIQEIVYVIQEIQELTCHTSPSSNCSVTDAQLLTTTNNWPNLLPSDASYLNDILSLKLTSPYVRFRLTRVTFLNQQSSCPQFLHSLSNCKEVYNIGLPFSNRTICGFSKDSTSNSSFVIWRASILSTITDLSGVLYGMDAINVIKAKQRIGVLFPKNITVSVTNLTIYSEYIPFEAAITSQEVDSSVSPAVATFTITIATLWPYKISQDPISGAAALSLTTPTTPTPRYGWGISITETTTIRIMSNNCRFSLCSNFHSFNHNQYN